MKLLDFKRIRGDLEEFIRLERVSGIRGLDGYWVYVSLDEIGRSYKIRNSYWDQRDGRLQGVSGPR